MGLLLSIFFGFAPMFFFAYLVYWMDRYEKEPKFLLGLVFVWGAVFAAGAAFLINTVFQYGFYLFTGSESATNLTTGAIVAPIIEESLKGFAVLLVFLVFRHEFDSILDGIVYAAIVAIGFAATENTFYIYSMGFQEDGYTGLLALAFIRVILVGWQHPFYTAFIGIGLALARLNRSGVVKLLMPGLGWVAAVILHSVHNTIAYTFNNLNGMILGTALDWSGWLIMLLVIVWAAFREQQWICSQLREEVSLGVISAAQYRPACSAWAQSGARIGALFSGRFRMTARFYQVCAELSYKKQQIASLGEETGNTHAVQTLRSELARLAPNASS